MPIAGALLGRRINLTDRFWNQTLGKLCNAIQQWSRWISQRDCDV